MKWLLIIPILIAYLLWSEHGSQNALNRHCNNSTPIIQEEDSIPHSVEKLIETLRKNHTVVAWRRSTLIALLLTIPIIYLIVHRMPNGFEFLIVAGAIAIGAYISATWIEYSWWYTHDIKIEKSLLDLSSKV